MDVQDFFSRLGLPQPPGQNEQLMLPGEVRLQADEQGWTTIFQNRSGDEDAMRAGFELSRQLTALVPFLTRSGMMGLRWHSPPGSSDAADAVLALRAALRQMDIA